VTILVSSKDAEEFGVPKIMSIVSALTGWM